MASALLANSPGMTRIFSLLNVIALLLTGAPQAQARFDDRLVSGIPTKGPNCYFTALTVNELLKVPAYALDDNHAAILFLNPAFCRTVKTPKAGDLGLEEAMALIAHVFTYIDPNKRFEKAGPSKEQPFTYVETPATTATRFIRCHPMQPWADAAIADLPGELRDVHNKLIMLEADLDVRGGAKSAEKYAKLVAGLAEIEGVSGDGRTRQIRQQLAQRLGAKGISTVPFPGMLNGDYYRFANEHGELLSDPAIFARMWLAARLADMKNKINYYNYDF